MSTRGGYDPAAARASTERLAALTDDQAAVAIRTAAADVLAAIEAWRRGPRWHGYDTERAAAAGVADALDALPTDAALPAVVDAVQPLLGLWWPVPVEATVAALRAALERPRMARQCRAILPHLDWIAERERQAGWA